MTKPDRSYLPRLLILVVIGVVGLSVYLSTTQTGRILAVRWFTTESMAKVYEVPSVTAWRPVGTRSATSSAHINAQPVTFGRALHTDLHGSDEVTTAVAPMFELDWTAEENMFVAEGPVFDGEGNVYFSPLFPPEDVIVVSIEQDTGVRRWIVEGSSGGAGTPLVLVDPDTKQDIIYVGTYDRALALTTDGDTLWDVPTGLPSVGGGGYESKHHSFGINYHTQSNSLIAVMGDGHVYVLDRVTGKSRLTVPFVMPGAPTPITNFTLPETISSAANKDIAHMYPETLGSGDPIGDVLHGAAGELQKVTNFFSIDSNTGRIWIAATLPDEEDGHTDGWSGFAALYGLDLVRTQSFYELKVAVVTKVPGGTASTPAVSADGRRIYVADAFDTVYAIDATSGSVIWSFNVGDKITGSINVAADNNELYANTRTQIMKLFDRGTYAELAWTAKLNMYETGRFQANFKSLGAEITANGIAFTGAAGVIAGKQKFPFRVGAGLIDRQTGEIRFFVDGAEDSVSSMVTGPDGGLYVGNSPLRRVLARATFGSSVSPLRPTGGVTRFKPVRHDIFLRDVLVAAITRAQNASINAKQYPVATRADVAQIKTLIMQAQRVAQKARLEGTLSEQNVNQLMAALGELGKDLRVTQDSLNRTARVLNDLINGIFGPDVVL